MAQVLVCACGKRLKVKDEFTGRRVACPACRQMIVVPAPPPATMESSVLSKPVDDETRSRAAEIRPLGWGIGILATSAALSLGLAIVMGGARFLWGFVTGFDIHHPERVWASAFHYRTRELFLAGAVGGALVGPLVFWALRLTGHWLAFPGLFKAQRDRDTKLLIAALEREQTAIRLGASRCLVTLALKGTNDASDTLVGLFALLDRSEGLELTRTSAQLGQLAPVASAHVPVLTRMLEHQNPVVRVVACVLLTHSGTSGRAALNGLKRLLDDPDETVRSHAENAINAITGKSVAGHP